MKRYASDPPSPGARHRRLALGVRHTNRRASSGRPTLIRVLVADAHPVVRAGLRAILAVHHDIAVLGEASTGAEACVLAATKPWDMVVLDMSLPDRNALDVLKDIKRHRPRLPILILSAYPEQGLAMRAFRAGATGYITKMAAPDELMSAVRRLAQGRRYMSAGVADELIGATTTATRRTSGFLTASIRSSVSSGAARASARSPGSSGEASRRSARIGRGSSRR